MPSWKRFVTMDLTRRLREAVWMHSRGSKRKRKSRFATTVAGRLMAFAARPMRPSCSGEQDRGTASASARMSMDLRVQMQQGRKARRLRLHDSAQRTPSPLLPRCSAGNTQKSPTAPVVQMKFLKWFENIHFKRAESPYKLRAMAAPRLPRAARRDSSSTSSADLLLAVALGMDPSKGDTLEAILAIFLASSCALAP